MRTGDAHQAVGWLDETPDKDTRVLLLVALRDITDGKIYVEAERAKLTRMLAKVCEVNDRAFYMAYRGFRTPGEVQGRPTSSCPYLVGVSGTSWQRPVSQSPSSN